MNKGDLIEQMAADAKITKENARLALEALIAGIQGELSKKDGRVTLIGFGTFSKVFRKERNGINPQTGQPMQIKAKNVIKFSASERLKKELE